MVISMKKGHSLGVPLLFFRSRVYKYLACNDAGSIRTRLSS